MAKWNPKYKINLIEVFNKAYASEPRELRDKLRPVISNRGFQTLYANMVSGEIVDRTLAGLDIQGDKHTGYTPEYKASIEFKLFKSQSTIRDLHLTGSMLASITPTLTRFDIVFGFQGDKNRGKAEGHISGRLGKHGKADPRDFFGLPEKLESDLLREAIKIQVATDLSITADLFNFDFQVVNTGEAIEVDG